MKIPTLIAVGSTVVFGAIVVFAASSSNSAPTTSSSRSSYNDFAVVVQKNIFMRDRARTLYTPGSRPSNTTTTSHLQKSLEEQLVLTGVVFEDGEYHAYVEDSSAEKILRLATGDSVAHGRIAQIEIDAVQYQPAGKSPTWIDIGSDFTGHAYGGFADSSDVSSGSSPLSTNPSTGPASSQPAINPNDPNLSIEQKMRLRAQQQSTRGGRR